MLLLSTPLLFGQQVKMFCNFSGNPAVVCIANNATNHDWNIPSVFLANDNNIEFVSLSNPERTPFGIGPDIDFVENPPPTVLHPKESWTNSVNRTQLFRKHLLDGDFLQIKWIVGSCTAEEIILCQLSQDNTFRTPVVGRFETNIVNRLAFVFTNTNRPELCFIIFNGSDAVFPSLSDQQSQNVLSVIMDNGTNVCDISLDDVFQEDFLVLPRSVSIKRLSFTRLFELVPKSCFDSGSMVLSFLLRWTYRDCVSDLPIWIETRDLTTTSHTTMFGH